jgi:hypothetical protein
LERRTVSMTDQPSVSWADQHSEITRVLTRSHHH